MGWGFSDFVDAVSDVGDAVGGAVSDVGEALGDAVSDVADTAFEYGSSSVTSVGGGVWDGALATIGTLEDISPDVPWVDIEVADGQLSATVDIEGVGAGISVGEHGVQGHYEGLLGSGHVGITDDGFEAGLAIGDTDWPQFIPALDVGVGGDWDGNVQGDFEAQGAFPIPGANGIVWGEVGGDFARNDDGTWGVAGHAEGNYLGADGTRAGGSVYGSYTRTEDGSATTAGASGYYARDDLYVGGSVDYVRLREGDDLFESLDADAVFRGYGIEAEGGVDYQHLEIDGEEATHFDAQAKASGHGVEASGSAAYDEFSNDEGTVSQWETDYSLDGVEGLVGADDLAASSEATPELGLDDAGEFADDPFDPPAADDSPSGPGVFEPEPLPEPEPVREPEPEPVAFEPEPAPAPEPVPAAEASPLDELNDL